jgi:phosphate-selective porin
MKKLFTLLLLYTTLANAQTDTLQKDKSSERANSKQKWFEQISLKGYIQVRYNRLLETNPQLKCDQCDRSWGEDGGIFIRRARVALSGQLHPRIYFYLQPDFASAVSSSGQNFLQLRDAYVDVGIDQKSEFKIRLGQSKIPYGFENVQSSQIRLPLDRNDALNSAVGNERDLAAILYWTPENKKQLFSSLTSEGYKGSSDYGILAFGVYNGQTANRAEQNNELHLVGRITYPFEVGAQVIEPSIQAYTGKYVVIDEQLSAGTKFKSDRNYTDKRVAASFILYPKPLGLQAEYNIGRGPEFNPATDSIETKSLTGGYATLSWMIRAKDQLFYPYVRAQYYSGGKKHELDARSHKVNEYEFGLEWQPLKYFGLEAVYTISRRRFEDFRNQDNTQKGRLLRLQAQVNF